MLNLTFEELKNIKKLTENDLNNILTIAKESNQEKEFFDDLAQLVCFDEKNLKLLSKEIKLNEHFKWEIIIEKTNQSLSKIPENHLVQNIIHIFLLKFIDKYTSDKDIQKAKTEIEKIKNKSIIQDYANSDKFIEIRSINKFKIIPQEFLNNKNVFPKNDGFKYSIFNTQDHKRASFEILEKHIEDNNKILIIPSNVLEKENVEHFLKYYPYFSDLLKTNLIYQNEEVFLTALERNSCFLHRKDIPENLLLNNNFIKTLFDNHLYFYSHAIYEWRNGFDLKKHPYSLYFSLLKERQLSLNKEQWKIILQVFEKAKKDMEETSKRSQLPSYFDAYFASSLLNIFYEDKNCFNLINDDEFYHFLLSFYYKNQEIDKNLNLNKLNKDRIIIHPFLETYIFPYFVRNKNDKFLKKFYPLLIKITDKKEQYKYIHFSFNFHDTIEILKNENNEVFCHYFKKIGTNYTYLSIEKILLLLLESGRLSEENDLLKNENICFLKLLSTFHEFYKLNIFKSLNIKNYVDILETNTIFKWIYYSLSKNKDFTNGNKEDFVKFLIENIEYALSILGEEKFKKQLVDNFKESYVFKSLLNKSLNIKELKKEFYYFLLNMFVDTTKKTLTEFMKIIKETKIDKIIDEIMMEL